MEMEKQNVCTPRSIKTTSEKWIGNIIEWDIKYLGLQRPSNREFKISRLILKV